MARRGRDKIPPARDVNYRQLRNPFPPMEVFSKDEIAAMHDTALRTLEELGMKVLLAEAREIFAKGGARIEGEMVYIGRDMVEAALASAPKSIDCHAGAAHRNFTLELGALTFQPGAGAPHATDLKRGRRPGSARDFNELVRLTQHFDVFQMVAPLIEPQDVPTHLRHYFTLETQLTQSDKFPFVFSRGTPQVMESFEMLAGFRGVSEQEFEAHPIATRSSTPTVRVRWIFRWRRG